jgi:predicted GNAT family acetyltransferase
MGRIKPSNKLVVRALSRDDWPVIETLFGERGACGGCWCMLWRVPKGGKTWEQAKGEPNRRAFRKLVQTGRAKGCLAFVGDEPVGWCSVAPRADFPRLTRVKALQTDWDEGTWSVTCFYIPSRWRSRGVATALLKHAVALARKHGAKTVEGYPVQPSKGSKNPIPSVFAWTGVNALFEKGKFVKLTTPSESRDVFVKRFKKRS